VPEKTRESTFDHTRRDVLVLISISLATRLIVAALTLRPGYMDTAYYAAGAMRIAQGGGLTEPFLWNYLDNPPGVPHTGFLYWMPLPSLLAAPFAAVFPGSFFSLQVPFALISSLLPPITYLIARHTLGNRRSSWVAGLLMLFSGFYFPYWTLPETFTPFALFGSISLWLSGRTPGRRSIKTGQRLLTGALVGLAHLTRSDGPLLLATYIVAPGISLLVQRRKNRSYTGDQDVLYWQFGVGDAGLVILGYLLVMAPWFARNISLVGSPLSPAGTKTLWLQTYDDLFCFNCELSLRSYIEWGWPKILRSKLWAIDIIFRRFLAENCLIFLFPFTLVGLWRLRHQTSFRLASVFLMLNFMAHSLAFTFPGPRGGFFHASAAVLPFIFTAGADGIDAAVVWAGRRRRWNTRQAKVVFSTAAVSMAVLLSVGIATGKIAEARTADEGYREVGRWLERQGYPLDTPVMIGNPPGLWYHTHQSSVVIPNGDVEILLAASDRYNIEYIVLDRNVPQGLRDLYEGRTESPYLSITAQLDDGHIMILRREQP
jgi:hypothetical protein